MDARQLLGHARGRHEARLAQAQARAFGLFGVGEARVDRQHQGGVAAGVRVGRAGLACQVLRPGTQQAFGAGVPEVLVGHAREARIGQELLVLLEAVAREQQLLGVGTLGQLGCGVGRLEHAFGAEEARGALLGEVVDARVELAAHGVVHHRKLAAHARKPRRVRHGVQRGCTVAGDLQRAGDALGAGDADAHARERAGDAPP